jgi:hypothetical protein
MDSKEPIALDYATPVKRSSRGIRLATFPILAYVAVMSVVTIVAAYGLASDIRGEGAVWACGFGVLVALWVRRRVYKACLEGREDDKADSERAFAIASYLLVLILWIPTVHTTGCPHGSLTQIGPIGIASSNVGGPCRNSMQWRKLIHLGGRWYLCF